MASSACESGIPGPVSVLPATRGCETLGYSAEGRPLTVLYCGNPGAPVRIFIMAGQHGDEPEARQAAAEFVSRFMEGTFRAAAHAAVLVDANPDGAATGERRNARDTDLNRDHLLLSEPETAAVHAFVNSWKPDIVIDVHTYRPWRRELMAFDLVYPQEIMVDFPTNPAISTSLGAALRHKAMDFVEKRLAEGNIRSDRYTIIRSGIVRHSNTDIVDARNGLALRFAIPTILIEGRRSSPDDLVSFTAPAVALLRAIESAVEWIAAHAKQLRRRPSGCAEDEMVPVRCRYSASRAARYMEMQSASRGEIARVRIPGAYLSSVQATSSIRLPKAYGVPRDLTGVLALLGRHALASASPTEFRSAATEVIGIEAMTPAGEADAPAIPTCNARAESVDLDGFVPFPATQTGARLLALLLEPVSQFGPPRLPELAETLRPGSTYPIIRLV
ncbi:MAG: M14 family zinc carboxypeptidase [Terracidiphilus sp.]